MLFILESPFLIPVIAVNKPQYIANRICYKIRDFNDIEHKPNQKSS
jgi:hypothetical protein